MLKKNEFFNKYPNLHEGTTAYDIEGDKLGKVVDMADDYLTIEKGFFFPKDFTIRYDDILETRPDGITVKQHREDLEGWKDEKYKGWNEYDRVTMGEEATIPVREEELEAKKVVRPKGEIHVRKVVHTEMKQFSVPVTKEEVIIERRPVSEATGKAEPIGEKEVTIPISEEHVEVTKRPVTKEEVNIRKEARIEEEKVKGEVRKEEIKIDRDEEERRRKAA